jgi:hypothetical protein
MKKSASSKTALLGRIRSAFSYLEDDPEAAASVIRDQDEFFGSLSLATMTQPPGAYQFLGKALEYAVRNEANMFLAETALIRLDVEPDEEAEARKRSPVIASYAERQYGLITGEQRQAILDWLTHFEPRFDDVSRKQFESARRFWQGHNPTI